MALGADALRERVARAENEKQSLHDALGVSDARSVIALVRRLEASGNSGSQTSGGGGGEPDGSASAAPLTDPRQALERFRAFTTKIDNLNGTVASMEDQLKSLYSDRERLEKKIGASEVDDVIAAFEHLQEMIENMETQLVLLYSGQEKLHTALGKSDPEEIAVLFNNVAHMVRVAHCELEPTVSNS